MERFVSSIDIRGSSRLIEFDTLTKIRSDCKAPHTKDTLNTTLLYTFSVGAPMNP
jgi:hypothetical protein